MEKSSTTAPFVSRFALSVASIDSVSGRAASWVAERMRTFAPALEKAVWIAIDSASTVLPVRRAAAIVVMKR